MSRFDARRAWRQTQRWIESVPSRLKRVPDHVKRLPDLARDLPRIVRNLTRRQWLYIGLGAAALIGVIAGLIAFVGGDEVPPAMSREEFVAEFRRVTDNPPDDELVGCVFDKTDGDRTLQLEALKEEAGPESASRLSDMTRDCRLESLGLPPIDTPSNPDAPLAPRSTIQLDDKGIPAPPPANNSPVTRP